MICTQNDQNRESATRSKQTSSQTLDGNVGWHRHDDVTSCSHLLAGSCLFFSYFHPTVWPWGLATGTAPRCFCLRHKWNTKTEIFLSQSRTLSGCVWQWCLVCTAQIKTRNSLIEREWSTLYVSVWIAFIDFYLDKNFSPNVKAQYHQENLITSNWPQSPYYLIQFRYRRQFHCIYSKPS